MSEGFKPRPPGYYIRAELENGEFSTLTRLSAQDALASASEFKSQGFKVKVTEPSGVTVPEAELQARAAREAAN